MRKCIGAFLCTFIAVTAVNAKADPASFTADEYVGSIQGNAGACKAIMPDAVKVGLEYVVSRFTAEGLDLAAYPGSDDDKKTGRRQDDCSSHRRRHFLERSDL